MSELMYGNREIAVADLLRLTALIGPVGEEENNSDTLFFRCERELFNRAEILEVVQIIARMQPDECELDGDDLRLWWD